MHGILEDCGGDKIDYAMRFITNMWNPLVNCSTGEECKHRWSIIHVFGKREFKRSSNTFQEPISNIKNGRMIMHI